MSTKEQDQFVTASCYLDLSAEGLVQVKSPFDGVTHSQLKKIRPKGTWLGIQGGWEFPLESAPLLLKELGSRFLITNELASWLELLRQPLRPLPEHSELIAAASLDKQLLDGRKALVHQSSGVSWLVARKAALLADEMGLGKTLTALLASRAIVRSTNAGVMVVAPACLHSHWEREAEVVGLSIVLKSWAKLPRDLPDQETILIVDEAHFAQSLKAKRTQALLRLARHPRLRAIWLLTGTPMKSGRALQLLPLLAAMQHPISLDKYKFKELYDGSEINKLLALNKLLKPLILHRSKKQVLHLPPKTREKYEVKLHPVQALGFDKRLSLVVDEYRLRVQKGLISSDAESLAILTALRQIGAEFKLPAAHALIKRLIEKRESVVCFSSFVKPLILLRETLGGELVTGFQSIKDRHNGIDDFQSGSSSLLLTTYGCGGLGLNFNRAEHVVLLERPWTPGDVDQAEDRCHRIGTNMPLKSHWFQLGFADQLVDTLIAKKTKKINIILGNQKVSMDRQSLPEMIRRCIQFV